MIGCHQNNVVDFPRSLISTAILNIHSLLMVRPDPAKHAETNRGPPTRASQVMQSISPAQDTVPVSCSDTLSSYQTIVTFWLGGPW